MGRLHLAPAAALLLLVAGCAAASEQSPAAPVPAGAAATTPGVLGAAPAAEPTGPLRVVAVGDSVTAADSPDFAAGRIGAGSWARTADQGDVDVVGGWAVPGATTAAMAAGVTPQDGDALVVMAGTNDVLTGVPWAESAAHIEQIVATVGIDRVLLCSIVPLDRDPAAAQRFDARLRDLAARHGWQFVDSAAGVRAADGTWTDGLSVDGIHPTPAAAALIGAAVHDALAG